VALAARAAARGMKRNAAPVMAGNV